MHQHLIRAGLRTKTGLVVETGSAREVHHFALLGGYGAEAIHPYLALESLGAMDQPETAVKNYIKAIGKGLNKVMSKMGISTYMSYTGAQIFEAVGLNSNLINKYFTGTASNIEGIGIFEVAEEALRMHRAAFGNDPVLGDALDAGGEYAWRVRGEEHMWTPDSIAKLQHATRANNYSTYKEYAQLINDQCAPPHDAARPVRVQGRSRHAPFPLDEVEPAKEIVKRFATGAMSLGSISTEAHTVLAVAMNRIGGKSNTGEGGEDELRYRAEMRAGKSTVRTAIRWPPCWAPIASKPTCRWRRAIRCARASSRWRPGRFGVSAEYLASADQIQIKMAQGAKPGEGGQLPGHKVVGIHRQAALFGAGRGPDFAAAAPRYLLDRRPGPTDPRPEERESPGFDLGQAGIRSRRGHGGRRRGQGQGRPRGDRRAMTAAPAPRRSRRSSMPARRGNSAWPKPSRRWC